MRTAGFLEKLLNGASVEWTPLDELAKIKHGKDWKKLEKGNIPVYGTGGIMGYVAKYSYNKPSVLIPRKGSITNIFYVDSPFWNVDTIYYTEIDDSKIIPKFLYYFIKTIDLTSLDTGSGRPSLTQAILNKIPIPVPCPEKPEKPLAIQTKIVHILDTFTAVTSELILRKKQYEYYRDALLTFDERTITQASKQASKQAYQNYLARWVRLDEIGQFIRGKRFTKADYAETGIDVIHYGEIYTQYGVHTAHALSKVRSDMAATLRYAEPGDVVMTDVGETVEDVGKAVAWLGDKKVAIHDHCYAFRHAMNPKFVSYCMQTKSFITKKAKHVARTKVNTLLINGFSKLSIPVPYPDDAEKSLVEQARIVAILDKFDTLTTSLTEGLPREIALRQQQYEYYRDLLLSFPTPDTPHG